MPESPKAIEEKLKKVEDAWALHAPNEVFGEMTLAQFRTALQPSRDARALLDELESKMVTAASERDIADEASMEQLDAVVRAVLGNRRFGPDSTLYEAMGYVRKSERKTGLTRKKKTPPTQ